MMEENSTVITLQTKENVAMKKGLDKNASMHMSKLHCAELELHAPGINVCSRIQMLEV